MPDLSKTSNRLLAVLSPDDLQALAADLEPVRLAVRQRLCEAGVSHAGAYFLDSGIASVVIGAESLAGVEVGIVGRDGMVGLPIVLGTGSCPHHIFMQVEGQGWRISAAGLTAAMAARPGLRVVLLRYAHCFHVQLSTTAYANADYSVEERLARWLLLCRDRLDGDDIHLTHEFLAVMLGVRRPGVTVATHVLEGEGMIKATRGLIRILDRAKLEHRAGSSYGIAEAEYERVFGAP